MMANLADVIYHEPHLRWITGTVRQISGNGAVTMSYSSADDVSQETDDSGDVYNVACLDQYTPVVNDIVHALVFENRGVLILGSGNNRGFSPPAMVTPAPITVTSTGGATWVEASQTWEPGVVRQQAGVVGCWFFDPVVLEAIQSTELEGVQLEITRIDGGRAQVLRHLNSDTNDPLVVVDGPRYQKQVPVTGVPTLIDMPIGWGVELMDGTIKGIGVTSNDTVSTYSTTARVQFQPLSQLA